MTPEERTLADLASARYAVSQALQDAQSARVSLENAIQSLQILGDMLADDKGNRDTINYHERVMEFELERASALTRTTTNAVAFAKPCFRSIGTSWAFRGPHDDPFSETPSMENV